MNLLIVTDCYPYPPERNGNTENIYNLILRLRKAYDYNIDLAYIGQIKKLNSESKNEIQKLVDNIILIDLFNSKFIRLSRWLFPKNLGIESTYSIVFFASFLSAYARFNFKMKASYILYQADSRTLKYSKKHGLENKLRYYKYKFEQRLLFLQFDKIIFVSEVDQKEVNSYFKQSKKTLAIPIGCNSLYLKEEIELDNKTIDLIFSGNFHFHPNSEAAIYFIESVAPELIERNPDIKIFFVGRHPQIRMINSAENYKDNIIITGEVPSIYDYLRKSKVYFSPLKSGSGMKNKILQAMAHALPIVASVESTSGFPDKRNFLIAESTADWINSIENLLNNENKRKQIGMRNLEILHSDYTFDKIVKNHFHRLFMELQ